MEGLQVIYEDNHYIAVNKPGGILVHGDETEDVTLADLVKEYIKFRYQKPGNVFLGVIHRLDRPVSGAIIFARTSKGLTRMNKMFKDREVDKTYLAITDIQPEPLKGTLHHFIAKDKTKNVARAYDQMSHRAGRAGAKASSLDYELISRIANFCLLRIKPHTGRPHQIRVQLSKMGWPIRGDVKYQYPKATPDKTIYLHCKQLSFQHPIKDIPVVIQAEPPHDQIWDVFEDQLLADGID